MKEIEDVFVDLKENIYQIIKTSESPLAIEEIQKRLIETKLMVKQIDILREANCLANAGKIEYVQEGSLGKQCKILCKAT